jgi:superfamily II DNA or RNA helicase
MAPAPGIHALTDTVLMEAYGPRSYERGLDYALEGRVTLVGEQPGRATGVVRGNGPRPYLAKVTWFNNTHGITIDDECSCPLGGDCKHCVALLVTARQASGPSEPPPSSAPDWRHRLSRLMDEEADPPVAASPLALQVTVARPRATHYEPAPAPSVRARPLRRGKNGRWVKTGAAWRDLVSPYRGPSLAFDEGQQRALATMFLAAGTHAYYTDNQAVRLDQFGPDVWFHLGRLVDAGVVLVDGRGDEGGVELAPDPASVVVDLTSDEAGAVNVTARLVAGGTPVRFDAADGALVGSPAHGLFMTEAGVLRLMPLAATLPRDIADLLMAPLVVPPGDVDELLEEYQPMLARHATVGSADGSVAFATTELYGLVLTIERTAVEAARLRWSVRYRRGERMMTYRFHSYDGHSRGRDRPAERALFAGVELPTHLRPALADAMGMPRDIAVAGAEAVTLLTQVVPWLMEHGQVDVEITGGLPELREATEDPLISLAVDDPDPDAREGTDWFDLAVEVSVDGEEVPFALLFAALHEGREVLILPSGTWLRLDRPELARLKELIDEARGLAEADGADEVRVNRFQASWFDELAELGVVSRQSDRWAASVANMRNLSAPEPVELPAGLEAKLRPYQQQGLDWLAFLHANGLGGILADDMGLGKTVQTLALCLHVLAERPDARFLVVAPTSVVEGWRQEAARFAPELRVRTIRETEARRGTVLADEIAGANLVVTSYALFRIEFDHYAAHRWDLALIDEAQFVKNHQGKTYQCVRRLDAATKVAITGTPLENSLMDLWSLLSIAAPGLYPDPQRFSTVYRKPIERGDAPELLATLRRRISPLMRRRTKGAVLTELPPKTEQTIEIELGSRHTRIYQRQLQRQRQKVLGLVGDMQRNRFEIFKSLTLLRQLSLDPALVDPEHANVGSAKLDRLLDDLGEVVAEGHRALVFSQFTRYLARLRPRLDEAGIAHAYLDGRTRKRADAIAAFKEGDAPVFVISLKAGGVGLNLTEADYCFVLDPWWNPAVETQAVDRAHRIGQVNPVMVYRYVSAGTIEEKVMELKARKAALFANVMDADGALSGALTADDIRGLFEP